MAAVNDLVGLARALKTRAGAAAEEYVVEPVQKAMGVYYPERSPTELPDRYRDYYHEYGGRMDNALEGFRRSTLPKELPQRLLAYRGDERRGGLETLPLARFDPQSPLKSDVSYWHTPGKDGQAPLTKEMQQMYAYARITGAARKLGLPAMEPDQFAAMVLKEGRPDAGFIAFIPQAKPDVEFRKKLNKYNIPEWQKDYLGMVNYAQRIAKKKDVPFEAVWNGLGRSIDSGKTGFDYAKTIDTHRKAVADPKNKDFFGFIQKAYQEGAKFGLPTVDERMRDIDPYYKSDPEYKYHNPDGTSKPHGINTLFKAEGGVVIDEGNPAKRRRLI